MWSVSWSWRTSCSVCMHSETEWNTCFAWHCKLKARETVKILPEIIVYQEFKASTGWCVWMMWKEWIFSMAKSLTLLEVTLRLWRKLVFQKHVIRLRKENNYPLSHIGNADETPVHFCMPSSYTTDVTGVKSAFLKTWGSEKVQVILMLMVFADGTKLPPYAIFNQKTLP